METRLRLRAEMKRNFSALKLSVHANEAHITAIMMTNYSIEGEAVRQIFTQSAFINK